MVWSFLEGTFQRRAPGRDRSTNTPSQSGAAGGMPAFEDVKPQLKEQVVQQKEGEAAQGLVEKLRADADVQIHL